MKAIVIFVVLVCRLDAYSQTVVLYKKTKNAIYVAADSRAVSTLVQVKNKGKTSQEYIVKESLTDTSCKIFFYKGVGMAFLGSYSDVAYKSAISALNANRPIMERIRTYADVHSKSLADTMHASRMRDPEAFEKYADPVDSVVSEALFFAFNADTIFMYYLYFKRKNPTLTGGKTVIQTIGIIPDKPQYCLGKCGQIQETMKLGATWKDGIVITLRNLANVSIKNNPKEVGGPIDIIMITRNGAKWVQRKNHCK